MRTQIFKDRAAPSARFLVQSRSSGAILHAPGGDSATLLSNRRQHSWGDFQKPNPEYTKKVVRSEEATSTPLKVPTKL